MDEEARQMIDGEVIWNIGGSSIYDDITVGMFYERERGTTTNKNNAAPNIWTKENDETYHKGIGLMYPSDYGYATNGGEKGREGCFERELGRWLGEYKSECANNDWLKPSSGYNWTLSPDSSYSDLALFVRSDGYIDNSYYARGAIGVSPVGYLLPSVTIYDGDGTFDNPFRLQSAS